MTISIKEEEQLIKAIEEFIKTGSIVIKRIEHKKIKLSYLTSIEMVVKHYTRN